MFTDFKSMYKPPIDLITEWGRSNPYYYEDSDNNWKYEKYFCDQGTRWGAKQELEACCAQISQCHLIPANVRAEVASYLHEVRMKVFTGPDLEKPLYRTIQAELDLYGSFWPGKIATLLELLAEFVEHRGLIEYDRDPGETADWLLTEAKTAKEEG